MTTSEYISVSMVLIGACFLFRSLLPAELIRADVPDSLCRKWKVVINLVRFFLFGYLFFILILIKKLLIPVEYVTGAVFLGGALFVFIIIKMSQTTILARKEAEENLKELNNSLEQRVGERTQELQRSFEFTRTILDSVIDPISIIDVDTLNIVAANKVFCEEYGLTEQQVIGKTCFDITHNRTAPCEAPHDICPLTDCLKTGTFAKTEHTHFMLDEEPRIVEVLISPIKNNKGQITQVVHIQRDITEQRRAEEQIRSLAYYDNLTGLPNRSLHSELLLRAIAYARRNSKKMATIFIDLDDFKKINDSLGHKIGDELLCRAAERISSSLRGSDFIARGKEEENIESIVSRIGGDEFIVLLNEIAQENDAGIVARRLLKTLEEPFDLSGNEVFITASIGISLYPADGNTVEDMIKNADMAMYHTKAHGKNGFHFYSAEMNHAAVERLSLENDMRYALGKDEFLLHYQPKIDAKSRKLTGMEALVRWQHPQRGLVSPLDFIFIAEETGFINPLGIWVLQTACRQNKKWQESGMQPLPVAVNLSLLQLRNSDMVSAVKRVLEDTGLDPRYLELEITESAAMHNPVRAISTMKELQAMGIKISIDDFGTGYSSLAYLRQLPVNSLKIDRSFVNMITTKPDDAVIVRTIIAMAHSLNLNVIAEGVETEEQYNFLQAMNCDEMQGYLFSRPVPAEDFVKLSCYLHHAN